MTKRRSKNPALLTGVVLGASVGQQRAARRAALRERVSERLTLSKIRPPRAPRQSRGELKVTGSRPPGIAMVSAPVASGTMMRGTQFQFGSAPQQGNMQGMRVSGRQIFCQVGNSNVSANTNILIPYGTTPGASVAPYQNISFDPDDTKFMPPPLTTLAQSFTRYVLRKCKLIYTPAVATSDGLGIAFAVVSDAAFDGGPSTTAIYNFVQTMEFTNAVAGPQWGAMSLEIPCDGTLRYVQQSTNDVALTPAEERQDHAFVLIGAASAWLNSALSGYIHLEYTIDLYDVGPSAVQTTLLRKLKTSAAEAKVDRKEETPDRDDEKAPISSSAGPDPQGRVPAGWTVVQSRPALAIEPPTPPRRVQSTKS